MADTLYAIELMANDTALQGRVRAATAKKKSEGLFPAGTDTVRWAYENRYEVASAPGWGEAWQYALDSGNTSPGDDVAVITDEQILAQVEALAGGTPPGQR